MWWDKISLAWFELGRLRGRLLLCPEHGTSAGGEVKAPEWIVEISELPGVELYFAGGEDGEVETGMHDLSLTNHPMRGVLWDQADKFWRMPHEFIKMENGRKWQEEICVVAE